MALPVAQLSETILAIIAQMQTAQCSAATDLSVDVQFDEEIKVSVSIIAPSGLNVLSRTSTKTGPATSTTRVAEAVTVITTRTALPSVAVVTSSNESAQTSGRNETGGDLTVVDYDFGTI